MFSRIRRKPSNVRTSGKEWSPKLETLSSSKSSCDFKRIDSSPFVGDSASFMGDSALFVSNSASFVGDSASFVGDSASIDLNSRVLINPPV